MPSGAPARNLHSAAMRRSCKRLFLLGYFTAVWAFPCPAGESSSQAPPFAGFNGDAGLWKVLTAETLPAGAASFSLWHDRISRNPGRLTVGTVGLGGAVGITDRLELGASLEAYRHVRVGRAEELSFGQQALGFFGDKTPGSPPLPSELVPGSSRVPQLRYPPDPSGHLSGLAGYYDLLPFAGLVRSGGAVGMLSLGAKYRALSESDGAPVGLAIHACFGVPIHKSIDFLMNHPVGTGDLQFGFDGIASRTLGGIAELHGNVGYRHINQPAHVSVFRLAGVLPVGLGLTMPRDARLQFVMESTAEVFVGARTPKPSYGAENPVDWTLGFRGRLRHSWMLSAGYRRLLNQLGGDKNGFVLSLGYFRRGTGKSSAPQGP